MAITATEAKQALEEADLIYSASAVSAALDRMAAAISQKLDGTDPLVLCVMNGGLIPAGQLLTRLDFPMKIDYIHATRYREKTSGHTRLDWLKYPETSLCDRDVLIIDDILDEGYTLSAIVDYCRKQQARQVFSAVLAEKQHDRSNGFKADFVGLEVVDRYVFGMGMDYQGYLRNVNGIYAVRNL